MKLYRLCQSAFTPRRTGASTDVISGQRGLIGGWNEHKRDGQTEFVRADLAAPLLQGLKVKALEWTKGVVDIAHPHPGMKYVACSTTPKGSWAWWLDNAPETRDVFSSEEAAKAAAQSAYEARILSALEPFANSYPQGANLAAHSKNENGPDHEPSPRAQALEEAALECEKIDQYASAAAIRALSSQPVADEEQEAAKTLLSGNMVKLYDACSGICKVHKFKAVLEKLASSSALPASPGASE